MLYSFLMKIKNILVFILLFFLQSCWMLWNAVDESPDNGQKTDAVKTEEQLREEKQAVIEKQKDRILDSLKLKQNWLAVYDKNEDPVSVISYFSPAPGYLLTVYSAVNGGENFFIGKGRSDKTALSVYDFPAVVDAENDLVLFRISEEADPDQLKLFTDMADSSVPGRDDNLIIYDDPNRLVQFRDYPAKTKADYYKVYAGSEKNEYGWSVISEFDDVYYFPPVEMRGLPVLDINDRFRGILNFRITDGTGHFYLVPAAAVLKLAARAREMRLLSSAGTGISELSAENTAAIVSDAVNEYGYFDRPAVENAGSLQGLFDRLTGLEPDWFYGWLMKVLEGEFSMDDPGLYWEAVSRAVDTAYIPGREEFAFLLGLESRLRNIPNQNEPWKRLRSAFPRYPLVLYRLEGPVFIRHWEKYMNIAYGNGLFDDAVRCGEYYIETGTYNDLVEPEFLTVYVQSILQGSAKNEKLNSLYRQLIIQHLEGHRGMYGMDIVNDFLETEALFGIKPGPMSGKINRVRYKVEGPALISKAGVPVYTGLFSRDTEYYLEKDDPIQVISLFMNRKLDDGKMYYIIKTEDGTIGYIPSDTCILKEDN